MTEQRSPTRLALLIMVVQAAACATTPATTKPVSARLLVDGRGARDTTTALARRPDLRLQVADGRQALKTRAAAASPEAAAREAARRALGAARESYKRLRFAEAIQTLEPAQAALVEAAVTREDLALLGELALQEALTALALDNPDRARTALSLAFLHLGRQPAPGELPPRVEAFISQARAALARAGTREINVTCAPPGARLIVDGKSAGQAPRSLQLAVGLHLLRAEALGHRGRGQLLNVGQAEPAVKLQLEEAAPSLTARQLLARPEPLVVGAGEEQLLIDVLRTPPSEPRPFGWLAVTGDAGSRQAELLWVEAKEGSRRLRCRSPRTSSLADCLGPLLHQAASGSGPAPAEPRRRPFYKTWWFWTITGAVVVGAVTAGAVVGARRHNVRVSIESLPSGLH